MLLANQQAGVTFCKVRLNRHTLHQWPLPVLWICRS